MSSSQTSEQGATPVPSDTINVLEHLEVLVKHKRIILTASFAAFALSTLIMVLSPNIYSATSLILPPQHNSGGLSLLMGQLPSGMSSLAGDLLGKSSPADLYQRMLTSDTVSDAIIDRFKLMTVYDKKFRMDTYKALSKKVQISVGKKDGVVTISVDDKDPKRAADIANAYVEELDKLSVKLDITDAGHDREFLENRLAKARADLARAEEGVRGFQAANRAIDVTEQAKGAIRGVGELEGQLAVEEGKLAAIRSIFRDGSEEVKTQQAVVTNLRRQIAKFEGMRSGNAIPGVASVPNLGQQYLRLMRELKIQEALVEFLTKQYELTKLSQAKEFAGVQVLQKARVPDVKSKPRRKLVILASTFVAGCLAALFALAREAARRMPPEDRDRWNRIVAAASFKRTPAASRDLAT